MLTAVLSGAFVFAGPMNRIELRDENVISFVPFLYLPGVGIGYERTLDDRFTIRGHMTCLFVSGTADFAIAAGMNYYPHILGTGNNGLFIGVSPVGNFQFVGTAGYSLAVMAIGLLPEAGYRYTFGNDGGFYFAAHVGYQMSYLLIYAGSIGGTPMATAVRFGFNGSINFGASIGYAF